jgi:predicted permease
LIRQLVTESLLIASAGGVLGLALGYLGILGFQQIEPNSDIPLNIPYALNGRVIAFGLGVAALSAALSSLIPAWQATRSDLASGTKMITAPSRTRQWGRHTLVCGQIALSLLLVTIAATIFRAFQVELGQGPGFRTDHLLMMTFDPRLARYDAARTRDFYRLLKERVAGLPGVASVALTTSVPMGNPQASAVVPEGFDFPRGQNDVLVRSAVVDEGYFETMNIAIVAGRGVGLSDIDTAPRVAVVNAAFAARYWPNQAAPGKRLRLAGEDTWIEVVGVAATTKYRGVSEAPTPFLYMPWRQHDPADGTLLVHTDADATALVGPIRSVLDDVGSDVAVFGTRTMEDFYLAMSVRPHNLLLSFVATMGMMGLALALIGLYGLVAYAVSQRTREIGIRMAVGAEQGSVVRMMLRRGLWLTLCGVALGVVGSAGTAGLLRAAIPSVQRIDGWTHLVVVPVLFAVTLLAAYIPARRAARVDPLLALRAE